MPYMFLLDSSPAAWASCGRELRHEIRRIHEEVAEAAAPRRKDS